MFLSEEMWLREETSTDIVKEAWTRGGDIVHKVAKTATTLTKWSKEKFGIEVFAREMRECKKYMNNLMEELPTNEVLAKIRAMDEQMDELERREEIYWSQHSRQIWLREGDRNTKFFHAKAMQRREVKTIKGIQDEAGNFFEDESQIAETFASFLGPFSRRGTMWSQGWSLMKLRLVFLVRWCSSCLLLILVRKSMPPCCKCI